MRSYTVHTYDVWGNAKDGYDVNDVYPSCGTVELSDDCTDADIIRACKSIGAIRRNFHIDSFRIDGEIGYSMYVNHQLTGYPVCELRPV